MMLQESTQVCAESCPKEPTACSHTFAAAAVGEAFEPECFMLPSGGSAAQQHGHPLALTGFTLGTCRGTLAREAVWQSAPHTLAGRVRVGA